MDNKKKKLLTIEDLVKFCENQQVTNFSSKESGYQLCVQVPATFKKKEVKVEDNTLLYCILKTCHVGLNRNGSYISEETMKEAMPTLKYKPILCNFTDTEDGKDFTSHDMEIDEDGNIIYIERQVGCFTADEPYLEYDEENDKTYVMAYAAIPRDYTEAADIIERKDGTKVSVELNINEMSYNGKEKYLQLDSFVFAGCTLLGVDPETKKEVGEGMKGSRLDIADFSVENNSVQFDTNEELLNEIKKLNEKLSHFNINQEESKSSEIYGKEEIESMNEEIKVEEEVTEVETVEETTETVEEFTEETVEEVVEETVEETVEEVTETEEFTEEVAEVETDEAVEEGTPEVGEEETEEVESEVEDETDPVVVNESLKPEKYSVMMSNGTVKEFALTLDEINNALYMLVNDTYGEADDAWYSVQVYEDGTLIMFDWWNNKAFRQSYKREEDNFSLVGDRVAVKQIWVTDEEESSLNEMKSNYASLAQFKEDTENAQLHVQREEILYNEKYSVLAEKDENNEYKNEAYAKLVSEMDNYSLTDLEKELKSVFADYITNGGQFAYNGESEVKPVVNKKLFTDSSSKSKKSSRYGNLFNK